MTYFRIDQFLSDPYFELIIFPSVSDRFRNHHFLKLSFLKRLILRSDLSKWPPYFAVIVTRQFLPMLWLNKLRIFEDIIFSNRMNAIRAYNYISCVLMILLKKRNIPIFYLCPIAESNRCVFFGLLKILSFFLKSYFDIFASLQFVVQIIEQNISANEGKMTLQNCAFDQVIEISFRNFFSINMDRLVNGFPIFVLLRFKICKIVGHKKFRRQMKVQQPPKYWPKGQG